VTAKDEEQKQHQTNNQPNNERIKRNDQAQQEAKATSGAIACSQSTFNNKQQTTRNN
jgi:hypothetical protein